MLGNGESQDAGWRSKLKVPAGLAALALVGVVAVSVSGGDDDSQALRSVNLNEDLSEDPNNCLMPAGLQVCKDYNESTCGKFTGCVFEDDSCRVRLECECYDQPPFPCAAAEDDLELCGRYESCVIDADEQECFANEECEGGFRPVVETCELPEEPNFCSSFNGDLLRCVAVTGCEYIEGLCTVREACHCQNQPEDGCASVPEDNCDFFLGCEVNPRTNICSLRNGCDTDEPTMSPTETPTAEPTPWPTSAPSSSPSREFVPGEPTQTPTAGPTESPTVKKSGWQPKL
mmetsp:Transcript_14213/g.25463  ORF Transcript_14213/g.25463 Transcript_14213/m.25463 type:complete len:288 (+) Transcript_14213:242-1105(+)